MVANPSLLRRKLSWALTVVLVIAIVATVNYVGKATARRWDVTRGKAYSLSQKTLRVLESLKGNVEATYFYKDNPEDETGGLLREYVGAHRGFRLERYDLDKHPEMAGHYGVNDYHTLVLSYHSRFAKLNLPDEQEITNALSRLAANRVFRAYAVTGHGEKSITDYGRTGCSDLREALQKQPWKIEPVALATRDSVPEDCDVLIVNGPRKPWTDHELVIAGKYLEEGGNLLLNLDHADSRWNRLLAAYGVEIQPHTVVDLTSTIFGASPGVTTLLQYDYSEITKGFRLMTTFHMPKSLGLLPDSLSKGIRIPFLKSSPESWAESGTMKGTPEFDEGKDRMGPVVFGVTVQDGGTGSRMVVTGDSEFTTNAYFEFAGNADLTQNILSWLTKQEDLIAIRAKELSYHRLDMTEAQAVLVFAVTLFFIPLGIVVAGVSVWWHRRRNQ